MIDSFGDRSTQVLLQQRDVVAVIDRPGLERELLAEQVEQVRERVDRWRNQAALDAGDRGLGGASPVSQLFLCQTVPASGLAKKLPGRHRLRISDLMYEIPLSGSDPELGPPLIRS